MIPILAVISSYLVLSFSAPCLSQYIAAFSESEIDSRIQDINTKGLKVKVLSEKIDPILFNDLMPESHSLHEGRLMKILGDRFDSFWTSVNTPHNLGYETEVSYDPKLEIFLDSLNITEIRGQPISFEMKRLIQNWLVNKATCKISYYWEDLGNLFWPRFIKKTICVNTNSESCSWPPGMKCGLSGPMKIHHLRWTCFESEEPLYHQRRKRANNLHKANNKKQKKRQVLSFWSPDKRKKQLKRLIRQTSLWKKGFQCEWRISDLSVSSTCECACRQF
uniref:Noggin-like protein 4 n=1 Tax=Schmidtea mediterranea TaxID=79327 RepID=C1JAC4_SCHMD|nr:noggin-like protein 4 [Schmidtea mediterranea]